MNFIVAPTSKRHWISLTPLIDVVFILLMFFMLTTQFFRTSYLDVSMQTATSTATLNSESIVKIEVIGRDKFRWKNGELFSFNAVNVRTLQEASSVSVMAVGSAKLQHVLTLLDMLSKAKVQNVNWTTSPLVEQ